MEKTNITVDDSNPHFAGKYFEEIDEISESENYFIPVLKEVSEFMNYRDSKILDVGCGTGIFMKPIIDAGCTNCYGVDGHTEFAGRAIARGYKEVKHVDDLNHSALSYEDNSFDLVVCKDVFEHLLNPPHALMEIKRVLKPGGMLLLHVPNHFPLIGRLKFLFSNNIDTFQYFKDESRWTFPHIRFYEHSDSLSVFAKFNLSLVKDLSSHFANVPFISRFSFLQGLAKGLTVKYPNQFAGGFTFLVRKNH